MKQLSVFLGITLLTAVNVYGRTLFEFIRDADESEQSQAEYFEVDEEEVCTRYSKARGAFRDCQGMQIPEVPEAWFILDTLQAMCRNWEEIRLCMEEKIANCPNVDMLNTMLDKSSEYCTGDSIPFEVEMFLEYNYHANLSQECMYMMFAPIFNGECDRSTRPSRHGNETMLEQAEYGYAKFDWYVECFMSTDLDEYISECSLTRGNAYLILITSVQVTDGFGIDSYPLFEKFVLETFDKRR